MTILTQDLHAYLGAEHAPTDVALYRVELGVALKLPAAVSFAASDPQAGEDIFTSFSLDWGAKVTYGRVGSEGAFLLTVASRLLQLDLSACSGNSGGGLFNERGRLLASSMRSFRQNMWWEREGAAAWRLRFRRPSPTGSFETSKSESPQVLRGSASRWKS